AACAGFSSRESAHRSNISQASPKKTRPVTTEATNCHPMIEPANPVQSTWFNCANGVARIQASSHKSKLLGAALSRYRPAPYNHQGQTSRAKIKAPLRSVATEFFLAVTEQKSATFERRNTYPERHANPART